MFLKVCNYNSIIYNIIKKQLFENVLFLKIYILNKNKQADLNLKNYIKKKIMCFYFIIITLIIVVLNWLY